MHLQRIVDRTETIDPKSNIRKVTYQVDAEFSEIKGLITLCKESSIITSKLVRMQGIVTVCTGQDFPIPATDINTCFDQISALHLVDLRNEEKQRIEKEKQEAKKLPCQTAWRAAS
jgi:excinuclease UvrABC helicase subunit UvrB